MADTAGADSSDALASIIHQVDRTGSPGGSGSGSRQAGSSSQASPSGAGRPVKADGRPAGDFSSTDVAVTVPAPTGPCSWLSGLLRACGSACPCCCADPAAPAAQSSRSSGRSTLPASTATVPASKPTPAGGQEALAAASVAKGGRASGDASSASPQRSVSTSGTPSAAAVAARADAASSKGQSPSTNGQPPRGPTQTTGAGEDATAADTASSSPPPPPPPPPPPQSTLAGFMPIAIPGPHRHAISRQNPLLPPLSREHRGKMCLVLDLDETLVHSNFKPVSGADLVVPVKLGPTVHPVHVMTRPGWQSFLEVLAGYYELVVFTASVDYYANPLLDRLDPTGRLIKHRLFRESCVFWQGNYIKDMSLLGRDERRSIIVDNSPASYLLHPQNALPCSSFFEDKTDDELPRLCRFLVQLARRDVEDVRRNLIEWSTFADGGLGEDDTDLEPMGRAAGRS